MSKSSNFSAHRNLENRSYRYKVIQKLGHNPAGGRVTYLATNTTTGQSVVIKQFQFAQSDSNWSDFKAYEREIQVLKSLNHTGIPCYLNSFETSKGFCMVQEYKDAQPLASPRSFDPSQIQQIAISALEILVYLQNQIPPIIHRDIKPENILVDNQLNVYLVDFGLARTGGREEVMSSVAAGTFGFMAPEQIYNRQLSKATDLYSLGATLICLLTQTKSTEIGELIDDEGRFAFKHRVSQVNPILIDWLERMVQPHQNDRYPSAAAAMAALQGAHNSIAQVQQSQSTLALTATQSNHNLRSLPSHPDRKHLYKLTEEAITLALTRRGTPTWTEQDFQNLLYTLKCAGYGWLKPEGVRQQLEAMKEKRPLAH